MLKKLGMDVSVLAYHPDDFFLPMLREAGVEYACVQSRSIPARIVAIRRALRRGNQDVVLAFQRSPSLYAELAGIPRRSWGLVVSERLAAPGSQRGQIHWLRKFHCLADYVTTNSHTNRLIIERSMGRLASRVVTIYNAVDLERFSYSPPPPNDGRPLQIVVAASFQAKKNPAGLVHAIALAQAKLPDVQLRLDWYGAFDKECVAYQAAEQCIERYGMREHVRLHPPSPAIGDVYRGADAVAHALVLRGAAQRCVRGHGLRTSHSHEQRM